ncbi:hypothetical protein AMELA_G00171550, partial [Ameiurus melas]
GAVEGSAEFHLTVCLFLLFNFHHERRHVEVTSLETGNFGVLKKGRRSEGQGKQTKTTTFREGIANWSVALQSLLLGISLTFQFPQRKHDPVALNLPASSGEGGG